MTDAATDGVVLSGSHLYWHSSGDRVVSMAVAAAAAARHRECFLALFVTVVQVVPSR